MSKGADETAPTHFSSARYRFPPRQTLGVSALYRAQSQARAHRQSHMPLTLRQLILKQGEFRARSALASKPLGRSFPDAGCDSGWLTGRVGRGTRRPGAVPPGLRPPFPQLRSTLCDPECVPGLARLGGAERPVPVLGSREVTSEAETA